MESDAPPSAPPPRLPRQRWVAPAVLLGWAVPGLGQLWAGRPRKALLFFVAILSTFVVGWWLTDFTVVNPQRYDLDFVAQAFLGGPTAFALDWAKGRSLESLPRFFDVGRLYVQVAGLLNLVAIGDAVGEVIRLNRRVLALRAVAAERRGAAPVAAEVGEGVSTVTEEPSPWEEEAALPFPPASPPTGEAT